MRSDGSPRQLTPRSKIKAMLAAVDEDSGPDVDDERPYGEPRKDTMNTELTNTTVATPSNYGPGQASSSDNEESPAAPRGKLAARLQGQTHPDGVQNSNDEQLAVEVQGSAYERIKEQLLSGKRGGRASHSPEARSPASSCRQSIDDEDAGPVIVRRRKKKQARCPLPIVSPATTPVRSRRSSPGLFMTPGRASASSTPRPRVENNQSDSDLPADPQKNERFLALVARKRAEREAKQAAEKEKMAAREARSEEQGDKVMRVLGESEEDSADDVGARSLTQQARPTRKASKKALEEMNRETQRMNRNMQLAHQAKTKKKVTKESLFARFNFRTAPPAAGGVQVQSSSTAASSVPASDAEIGQNHETPPSSPLEPSITAKKLVAEKAASSSMDSSAEIGQPEIVVEELPRLQDLMSQPRPNIDKGKGKAVDLEQTELEAPKMSSKSQRKQLGIKVQMPRPTVQPKEQDTDLDSELEILPMRKSKGSKLDIFNRLPVKKASEARSLQTLRALAHLNSPPGKQARTTKHSMTLSEMQASLQQRARLQAAAERAEKIQDLKNKGIVLPTAEERQKDQAEIEDLVEKAREEAEAIKKQEKDAARKEKKANGGEDELENSSDDEDYQDNAAEESDFEFSGSEEEQQAVINYGKDSSEDSGGQMADQDEEEGGVELFGNKARQSGFIEDAASEDSGPEDSAAEDAESDANQADDEEPELPRKHNKARIRRIIDSDDEEEELYERPPQDSPPATDALMEPHIPGLEIPGLALPMMGMTQAFAATMADTQTQAADRMVMDQEQDSMSFLGPVPEPNFPIFDANDTESMIVDSQDISNVVDHDTAADPTVDLQFSPSQLQYDTSKWSQDLPMQTQEDDVPDPTQDVGFGMSSPAANRFVSAPPSTVETVLLPGSGSPLKKRKGRLQRANQAITVPPIVSPETSNMTYDSVASGISANAFDVLKRNHDASAFRETFDKKKSEAKDMVEDQALESEDEYAGLGGASDEESGGSEDEEVRKMIEHEYIDVDEGKLAALFADKERARDNAAISKLYKDITTGGLRRNRGGADFDLSDSEDDAEARQRAKRLKEAKLRKALLEDERVGKIAEDPRKLAFIRAIEDREEEHGFFLDEAEPSSPTLQDSTQEIADSQPAGQTGHKRKRPLSESIPDAANRPPPAARRTKGKRPSTLAEIRESVSFLMETPESASFLANVSSPPESDNEIDTSGVENHPSAADEATAAMPPPPTRNPRRTGQAAFTDRLALLRSSTSASSSTRLAFAPSDASDPNSTFRVPSLLRRASTSNLQNAADANGISHLAITEQSAGGERRSVMPKKGHRKGCSILGAAREVERRAVVEGLEKKRKEERERIAKVRRSGMGSWGASVGWEV